MSLVPTPHQQRPPRRDSRLWKMISFFTGKQAKDHQEEPMPSRALMPREQVASKVQFFESAEVFVTPCWRKELVKRLGHVVAWAILTVFRLPPFFATFVMVSRFI